MPTQQPSLTPQEAAAFLVAKGVPVTTRTVQRWARAGRIRHIPLPNGRVRVLEEDLVALVQPTDALAAGGAR